MCRERTIFQTVTNIDRNHGYTLQVRQHEVPPGKHALIHVKQPRGQLVAVRARPATQAEPPPRELRLWQDCDIVQVRKAIAKIGLAVINSRRRPRQGALSRHELST